jgi:hypothetical protein
VIEYTIIFGCAFGLAWSSFKLGMKSGAEACLEVLHKQNIICTSKTGELRPNPFYISEED